jgi:hypothetical protein
MEFQGGCSGIKNLSAEAGRRDSHAREGTAHMVRPTPSRSLSRPHLVVQSGYPNRYSQSRLRPDLEGGSPAGAASTGPLRLRTAPAFLPSGCRVSAGSCPNAQQIPAIAHSEIVGGATSRIVMPRGIPSDYRSKDVVLDARVKPRQDWTMRRPWPWKRVALNRLERMFAVAGDRSERRLRLLWFA